MARKKVREYTGKRLLKAAFERLFNVSLPIQVAQVKAGTNYGWPVVSWGRDYADVSPIKGVCVGGGRHSMEVAVHVTRTA
jgi:hypothetical protein